MKSFDYLRQFSSVAKRYTTLAILGVTISGVCVSESAAQQKKKPSDKEVAVALSMRPKQDVDYDFKLKAGERPSADMVKNCFMDSSVKKFGKSGYVLADSTNRVIRVLLDVNKDRDLDFWSYYKDGVEVYREVDTDYDSDANEYRWMGSAGTRWGIDRNQDGEIDQWKVISAEEVAYEVFMAIKNRDDKRYMRLLLTPDEFKSLGLSGAIAKDAAARLKQARTGFPNMVRSQKVIDQNAKWINSGNGQPSLAPQGDGLSKDLICHDHASSVFETSNGTDTLALGTMVKIGDTWRLMELPQVVPRGKQIKNGGLLFPVVQVVPPMPDGAGEGAIVVNEKLAGLYEQLTKFESDIAKGEPGAAMAALQEKRARLQWDIYRNVPANEKSNWLENIGDTVSNAYQQDLYPEGLNFLKSVIKTLRSNGQNEGLDYLRWRMLNADYYRELDGGDQRSRAKATEQHYRDLEAFVKEFPKSKFAPEAVFAIAQNYEVSRNADPNKALEWYKVCVSKYGDSSFGKRAAGAIRRLQGRGKAVPFVGKTVDNKTFDISNRALRGKIVIVYYWEMWCSDQTVNAKGDTAFDVFEDLKSKYKNDDVFVSAYIDTPEAFTKFKGKLNGMIQLNSPGGMENSPLAAQLGVVSEPMMAVWDKQGILYDTESAVGDADRIIQKLLKSK